MAEPSTAQVDTTVFSHGDCRDAALGTLLRRAGLDHPEALLCGELNFVAGRTSQASRDVVIMLRTGQAETRAEEACGPRVKVQRLPDRQSLLRWIEKHARATEPVAITVDHWEYEPSQFF